MDKEHLADDLIESLPETLNQFTLGLIQDLKALRAGDITLADARARAQLAREVLRSVHLEIEGRKLIALTMKQVPEGQAAIENGAPDGNEENSPKPEAGDG